MTEEEKLQQKYLLFQQVQQQIEQFNQHLELLNQQNVELDISTEAVKGMEKTKIDNEILVPLANGIFLKGALKDNQKLIVNVGADITVEKTFLEVVELLEKQKKNIIGKVAEAKQVMLQLENQAMQIYKEVQKMVEE